MCNFKFKTTYSFFYLSFIYQFIYYRLLSVYISSFKVILFALYQKNKNSKYRNINTNISHKMIRIIRLTNIIYCQNDKRQMASIYKFFSTNYPKLCFHRKNSLTKNWIVSRGQDIKAPHACRKAGNGIWASRDLLE